MEYSFPDFIYAYVIAGLLSALSAVSVSTRRTSPGSEPFTYLLLALTTWSLFTIFEAGATQVVGKLFWSKFQYLGVISVAPLWMYFTADFSNRKRFINNRFRHLIWVIPIITLVLAFTNEYHGLLWKNIIIPPESKNFIAIYEQGKWFLVNIIYSYTLLLIGSFWITQQYLKSPKKRRRQALIIILMLAISWGSNIIYVTGNSPIPGLDLTSLSFSFIGVFLSWFIYRKKLFDVIPIARNRMVDNMSDGLIIVDTENQIIDVNPAALSIINYAESNPIGMQIGDAFSDCCEEMVDLAREQKIQTQVEANCGSRFLDIKVDSILDEDGGIRGKIIMIRDITARHQIEMVEEEQRKLAQALAETAAVVNSSLELDEVLDQILEIVGNVVPHETANISLMDEDGWINFTKVRGYEKLSNNDWIRDYRSKLDEIPSMRTMADTLKPYIEIDTNDDPDWVKIPGSEWIRSYLGAPIHFKGKILGFIKLDSSVPGFFKPEQLPGLQAFADQAAVAIQNAQLYEEMQHLALTDSLTGLFNRRYFFAFLDNEIARSKRYEKNLSLIMMDIDHFKKVNDTFGHQSGDMVLKLIAEISLANLRRVDVMCRFGGEEFAVLLPETPVNEAEFAAERICRKIESACLKTENGEIQVTASIGVAGLDDSIKNINDMIGAADRALYTAKEAGRNCVRTAG